MTSKEDRVIFILLLIYYTVMVSLAFIAKGTGDDSDSVAHFLFARYAFHHPENLLSQWAKPLFVLIASPFAQFGFIGIKIFNVTVSAVTIYFSYRSAKLLQISNAWFVAVTMCFAPMYIHLSLSGLTEPLFALVLIIIIFLALKEKQAAAALLVSFLPFLRSEGLIILCVYLLYLLFKKSWKLIPLIATGHVVYSLIGYFYYKDFLWIFNQLPYAKLYSAYGSGSPLVFVYGMIDYLGWVLLIFFCLGVAAGITRFVVSFFRKGRIFPQEEFWLVYGSFFSVWVGHMIFWILGIFDSAGLMRVLIGVIPCASIICARGFSVAAERMKISSFRGKKYFAVVVLVLAAVIAQLCQLNWKCDFDLTGSQKAIDKASSKYKDSFRRSTIYSSASYVSVAFSHDFFDPEHYRPINQIFSDKDIPRNSVVVWDDFFSKFQSKISLNSLVADDRLELLDTFKAKDCLGSENQVIIFRYKGPDTSMVWVVNDTLKFYF